MGILTLLMMSAFYKDVTGFIPMGVSLFAVLALLHGIVTGVIAGIRKIATKPRKQYVPISKTLLVTFGVPIVLCLVLAIPLGLQATEVKSTENTQQSYQTANADEVLTLVNQKRGEAGVEPLIAVSELQASAQFKAEDMANRNYTEHADPATGKKNGLDRATELVGDVCSYISENLYSGTIQYVTSSSSVNGWLESPAHKTAMLDKKYTYTGIGIATGKDGTVYQVQHFCQTR